MTDIIVDIAPATTADLSAIQQCATEAYERYVSKIGQKPAPMVADFETQIRQEQVFVATVHSNFAGYIVFFLDGRQLHLENVAVMPTLAGQGIGKKLIQFAEQHARQAGLASIELYTNEAMTENLLIYPKLGYKEVGRKTQDGFHRVFFRKCIRKCV